MSYDYARERPKLFTEDGAEMLIRIRDQARGLLKTAGAVRSDALMNTPKVSGDTWTMMACMDYLCEKGTLREITGPTVLGQRRVFVAGNEWDGG